MSGKGGFPAILLKNLKVIVTVTEVQFGEELGTLETVNKI